MKALGLLLVLLICAHSSMAIDRVGDRHRRVPNSPPKPAVTARPQAAAPEADYQAGYRVEEAAELVKPEDVAKEFRFADLAQGNAEGVKALLEEKATEKEDVNSKIQEALTQAVSSLTPRIAANLADDDSMMMKIADKIGAKVIPSILKPVQRALSSLKKSQNAAEEQRFREEQPSPSLQILAQTTNVQQVPSSPGQLALAGSRPGIPSNVAVSTAQALQPAASPRTDIGNPAAGTFAVQAVPGVRILNPDGTEPCGCPESGGPCDNPCAPTRTVSDEIEDKLDLVKTKIVQDAQKVQQNTQWIKEVEKIVQHYNQKIKAVNEDTGRVREEIRKLFTEKKRFEDLLLQQKLDVTTFDKIVQKQKDLGLTCASPPSTC